MTASPVIVNAERYKVATTAGEVRAQGIARTMKVAKAKLLECLKRRSEVRGSDNGGEHF
jgi:hypothetical protein